MFAALVQLVPRGFAGQAYRATKGAVYAVVDGEGEAAIGEETYRLGPRDVAVVPSWAPLGLAAASDLVLFSFSDRAAQTELGLWREQRSDTSGG